MQKQFIDDIVDKELKFNFPSPVSYEPARTFGKTGIHFSVPGRLNRYGKRVDKTSNYYLEQ